MEQQSYTPIKRLCDLPEDKPTRHWWNSFMPHENIGRRAHPLFKYEARRMARRAETLFQMSQRWLWSALLCAFFVWFVVFAPVVAASTSDQRLERYGTATLVIMMLAVVTVIVKFLLDFLAVWSGMQNGHEDDVHHELVQISIKRHTELALARHVAALVRVWSALLLAVALRIVLALLVLSMAIGNLVWADELNQTAGANSQQRICYDPIFQSQIPCPTPETNSLDVVAHTINVISFLIASVLSSVLIVLEPFWRVQVGTAIGLAVKALETQNPSLPIFIRLLRLWVVELLIFGFAFVLFAFGSLVPMSIWFTSLILMILYYYTYKGLTGVYLDQASIALSKR